MRKINFLAIMLICGMSTFAQAVKDRNIIPVAVNLNQVLRMNITNGGNIEFVFNTIADYKNGIGKTNDAMYLTSFEVASSTRWALDFGAETTNFIGNDNPLHLLPIDNVGLKLNNLGSHKFDASLALIGADPTKQLFSAITDNTTNTIALPVYPSTLITDNTTAAANAGDAVDNKFSINWRCGTKEGTMNGTALIDQKPSPTPDRYVVNVLFDLSAL